MLKTQEEVKEFCKEREWDNFDVKDLLLNMNDEIGEVWNLIKWVDEDKQIKLFEENKEEVEDFIGDMLFIVLKIANHAGINSEEAIKKTLLEYKKRFPLKEKRYHANIYAGGVDKKYKK